MTEKYDGPERRGRGRPSTFDREAALEAASAVIAERGVERARYRDVSDASGIPVTTLQHAFGSLNAMLLEALRRATVLEIETLRERNRRSGESAWSRLLSFVEDAVRAPGDGTNRASWLLWMELWRLVARDATIAQGAAPIYEDWLNYVAEIIEQGNREKVFSGTIASRPREAAAAINAIIDGVAVSYILRADSPDLDEAFRLAIRAIAAMLEW